MKHKICIFLGVMLLSGCGVELKDKDQGPALKVLAMKPDYVINEALVLKEHTTIETDRLVLTKNAVIITQDKNLVINAKELVSEGALLRNFSEGQKADWKLRGRSGGNIVITVGKAQGSLQVILQGEGGGPGLPGAITTPGHPGCAGTSGGDGGSGGSLTATILDNSGFNLNFQNLESPYGAGGIRGSVPYETFYAVHPPCVSDGPEGSNGSSGSKGQVCLKLGGEESFRCE